MNRSFKFPWMHSHPRKFEKSFQGKGIKEKTAVIEIKIIRAMSVHDFTFDVNIYRHDKGESITSDL